ncbi:peptidoglycan D,D-transpeptidase FtsI family protein [Peribacillus acanthi]|uniref:peptidoglycan D,D-transpeptidase FtsI family protein n=1 Tax=Peribacillus acanthi TaxID=2171554 RepID=UPI00196B3BE0|nr:penicillin-binding transpeptidase domain-containing protein [Peribacillus acanthi]
MLKKKRIYTFAIIQMLLICALLGRIAQIQLIDTESFSKHHVNLIEASVDQRSQTVTVDDGRGKFYDRFGNPLGHEEIPTLILFPFLKKMTWPSKTIASLAGINEEKLLESIEEAKEPFAFKKDGKPIKLSKWQMEQINNLKIPGIFAVEQNFGVKHVPAQQLIGGLTQSAEVRDKRYGDRELSINTKFGDKGLQEQFDEVLLSSGESKLVFHVDGTGGPLFGLDVKYLSPSNPYYPVKVITTIDQDAQRLAETLVAEHHIEKGGLILLDIETSEIRALVSKPDVSNNPNEGEGAHNFMFKRATPGSVFKTVVAAAAIESGIIDTESNRMFNCDQNILGQSENVKRKLGQLNFVDSFAQSCNRTFAELANDLKEIKPELLEEYAEKLNLIGRSGWTGELFHNDSFEQLYKEEEGRVWGAEDYKKDKNFISQTAIGQKDVQVTPLAIANMMATIAKGGERNKVKAVDRLEYADGTLLVDFNSKKIEGNKITSFTAQKLQMMLREVVTNSKGTGALLNNLPYSVAGKSGTAETQQEHDKENLWFAGYFPFEKPKYALVTVRLNATEGDEGVKKLFAEMVTGLYTLDHREE